MNLPGYCCLICFVCVCQQASAFSSFPRRLFRNPASFRFRQTFLAATTGSAAESRGSCDVSFISPLLNYGYRPAVDQFENGTLLEKPVLLYLPGFDGSFLSPFLQFPELSSEFDVRCMNTPASDRSTYIQVKGSVVNYISSIHAEGLNFTSENTGLGRDRDTDGATATKQKQSPFGMFTARNGRAGSSNSGKGRHIYLAGESFGGILAADIALQLLEEGAVQIKGLTLVNPATCFERSRLATIGPDVASLSPWLYPTTGLGKLLPLFTDKFSLPQLLLILQSKALPSVINSKSREAYLGRVALSLPFVLPSMPQNTLDWRLDEWLMKGSSEVCPKLKNFKKFPRFPTLLIVGEDDACLPSIDEAERLSRIFPVSTVHVVEGAGHASTCGSRVDITALMRSAFGLAGPTSMSKVAAKRKDEYLGMEPRYDGAEIGLNPLLYWSRKYYKRCKSQ